MVTEQLVNFFAALADVTRLKLVGLLAQGEKSVEELSSSLDVKQPTVSHHLAKLRQQGIVKLRKEGQVHYYQVDEEALHKMAQQVLSTGNLARLAPPEGGEAWERKVLSAFFDAGGRLREIPAQRKKRDVVLKRLVAEFEPGRKYPESAVNETLRRFHDDVATLRREFIMTKMMSREDGQYWRIDVAPSAPPDAAPDDQRGPLPDAE